MTEAQTAREALLSLMLTPLERRVLDALKEGEYETVIDIKHRAKVATDEETEATLETLRSHGIAERRYRFTALGGKVYWWWFRPKSARRWIREEQTK